MQKLILKNKKTIILSAVILVFLGFVFFVSHKNFKQADLNLNTNANITSTKNPAVKTVLQTKEVDYEDNIAGEISVYGFMSKLRSEGKTDFTEKNYIGMGELITGINGVKNNNEKSWIYYVNGKEASVGVSNYKINKGDLVSWKYEKTNF